MILLLALISCFTYLGSDRVLDPNNANSCEVTEDVVLIVPVGLGVTGEIPVGHANGPQPITGHGLNHLLHHLVLVTWTENPGLAAFIQDMAASGTESRGHQEHGS